MLLVNVVAHPALGEGLPKPWNTKAPWALGFAVSFTYLQWRRSRDGWKETLISFVTGLSLAVIGAYLTDRLLGR